MSLSQYKVLVYDCYGTLIDWEKGMEGKLGPLLKTSGLSREALSKVLGKHETRIQTETPTMLYPDVLYESYKATANELKLPVDEEDARRFGNAVPDWPAFEDSADALKVLQDLGLKQVILSNVNKAGFAESRKKLEAKGAKFDAVYVAEMIGSYKPSLSNFNYMLEHIKQDLGIEKNEILVVANSTLHDIQPAHKVGLKGAWIKRDISVMGTDGYAEEPDWEFEGMKAFASRMVEERRDI